MDRQNYYFKQYVDVPDLQRTEDAAERADRAIVKELIGSGLIADNEMQVVPNVPADGRVRITPGTAYDSYGQRVHNDAEAQSPELLVAFPVSAGKERWLTLVARFTRKEYEDVIDGRGLPLKYRQDEYREFVVLAGEEAEPGTAIKPTIMAGDILLIDIKRYAGQVAIKEADLDRSRRSLPAVAAKATDLEAHIGDENNPHRIRTRIAELVVSNWTLRPSAVDNVWTAIYWSPELKLFVAVANTGAGNRVMTSPDGINWTARASAGDYAWADVCWSPELGLFVAVAGSGAGSAVMSSPDGINWTAHSISDKLWIAVCWSPELRLFVAVSNLSSGYIATSPDGVNWTEHSTPSGNLRSICWSPELRLFAAIGTGDNRVIISPDGVNWSASSVLLYDWKSICWSPELRLFAAVANTGTGNKAMTSPDGVNWTLHPTPNNTWTDVCWSPELGLFVAVADSGANNCVMTSPDGESWTARPTPNNIWKSVCWAPELKVFVAVAASGTGNRVMTSLFS